METSQPKRQILTAYDFSEPAELALAHMFELMSEEDAQEFHCLVVLHPKKGLGLNNNEEVNYTYATEVQEMATKNISNILSEMVPGRTPSILVHVRIGDPAKEILGMAREVGAHLIIMGSHGRTGLKRLLLGSVSEQVVREALCPVLIARERTYVDVPREHIVPTKDDEHGPAYVRPHRFRYETTAPHRPKAWALY